MIVVIQRYAREFVLSEFATQYCSIYYIGIVQLVSGLRDVQVSNGRSIIHVGLLLSPPFRTGK